MKITGLFFILSFLFLGCGCSDTGQSQSGTVSDSVIRIEWDTTSIEQLAPKGGYPRLLRLQDSSIVVVYESFDGNIALIRSYDDGITWSSPEVLFKGITVHNEKGNTGVNMSNPEIYQLDNGYLIAGANYRPVKEGITPFAIAVRRSTNNGQSWEEVQVLYEADLYFNNGCWEPSFLELPDGELQLYFANESPFRESDEQEIALLSSPDHGSTWTKEPRQVSFRKGRRDGMPVSRIFGDEIVTVIEDNHVHHFKPYTVRTKISDNWSVPVLTDSPGREYALAKKVDDGIYMGAPYLLKLPTGESLLSYQSAGGRSDTDQYAVLEVAIGDKEARNFSQRTQPIPIEAGKEAKWNSLAIWDENTVVALTSGNFASEEVAPYLIKGYIIREVEGGSKQAFINKACLVIK